ncbi:50S ribosomal protein L6, partial [Candidatus Bathyarchaeota archaeon]|nr:50S ribosomal protein L6 [Candidatus Bathyarchaeota archaeon]
MREIEVRRVKIPDGVKVNVNGKVVEVIGEKGRLVRDFSSLPVSIQLLQL